MAVKSAMVSCSVAQAKQFVKAGVYVMPARHDQEGAPQVGYKHWMHDPEAIELPRAQPLNTLRRQLKMVEGGPVRSRTTILRTGASDAQVSLMHHARVFPCQPTRFTCSFTLYARAQIEFVRLCGTPGPKGGRQVGLDIQVQLLESIHSQSTPDTRAAQEQR